MFLHEQCRKFLEGGGLVQHSVDLLSQLVQLGLVDGLGGLLPFGGKFGVGMVEAALSAPLRPILPLRNMVALGFQQIDLVQVGLLAHLHDCDTEVPEHGRGAAVLLARFPVARLVHEGLPFHGADTQAADDDVDVDVPGTVVTVRVGADDGGMTGEVVLAELQAKGLRPLHGQVVLYCVLRVEADEYTSYGRRCVLRTNILASALADVAIYGGSSRPPACRSCRTCGWQADRQARTGIRRTQGCRADTNPAAWVCPSHPEWADQCTRCAER